MSVPLTVDQVEEHLRVGIKGHAALREMYTLFTSSGCICLPGDGGRVVLHKGGEQLGDIHLQGKALVAEIRMDL